MLGGRDRRRHERPPPTQPPRRAGRRGRDGARQQAFSAKHRAGRRRCPSSRPRRVPDWRARRARDRPQPAHAYRDIFNGAGLNWIFHPRRTSFDAAAYNLSQTLLQTTTLILTGLAVAFAFRCGMFNIGGQGQYFIGLDVANWIGSSFADMSPSRTSCSRSSPPRSPAQPGRGSPGSSRRPSARTR